MPPQLIKDGTNSNKIKTALIVVGALALVCVVLGDKITERTTSLNSKLPQEVIQIRNKPPEPEQKVENKSETVKKEPVDLNRLPESDEGPPLIIGKIRPVMQTPSGLQFIQIEKPRSDKTPIKGSRVTVHYTGWLTNQQKFDSSRDNNEPFTFIFGVGQVIRGWDEGIATMRVGEKRRLLIPTHLAYGERGVGETIPPNADLIFDVELLDVKDPGER